MFNDATTKLEIRATTGSVWVSRILPALVVVLFFAMIAAYYFGKHRAVVDWEQATEEYNDINEKYHSSKLENRSLKENLAFETAKSSSDLKIKRQAYNEIAKTLAVTSKEIATLREDIRFYESIIEGDEKKTGLEIKSVLLHAGRDVGDYRYSVIIVNGDFGKAKSKGKLLIEIEGLKKGKLTTLKGFQENTWGGVLLFKYFQRIDGTVLIPKDFLPQRLHLTARLTGNQGEKKEKWYNWNILLNKKLPVDRNQIGS